MGLTIPVASITREHARLTSRTSSPLARRPPRAGGIAAFASSSSGSSRRATSRSPRWKTMKPRVLPKKPCPWSRWTSSRSSWPTAKRPSRAGGMRRSSESSSTRALGSVRSPASRSRARMARMWTWTVASCSGRQGTPAALAPYRATNGQGARPLPPQAHPARCRRYAPPMARQETRSSSKTTPPRSSVGPRPAQRRSVCRRPRLSMLPLGSARCSGPPYLAARRFLTAGGMRAG
jgi:hypothetical protein